MATTSHRPEMTESTSPFSHSSSEWPPYLARMAAPPERMNVSPAIPMNSDSSRRSR
jgi:hypothetical protein